MDNPFKHPRARIVPNDDEYSDIITFERNSLFNISYGEKGIIKRSGSEYKEDRLIHISIFGDFESLGMTLSSKYNWTIVKNNNGSTVLVPSKKENK